MRYRSSVVLVVLVVLPALGGCKKKAPAAETDPAAASGALTSVPVTGTTPAPTAPPVMIPDTPAASATEDAGLTPGQRKRRTVKGQHAHE